MFKEYASKPIIRRAHKIVAEDVITKLAEEATYRIDSKCAQVDVKFKAYEEVKAGDYIVYLDDTDIYHCSENVFRERNIIPEQE